MTGIGKLLVFFNLVLGMAFLSWSVGLYTERIEWIDRQVPGGEKVEGELTRLKTEVDERAANVRLTTKAWGESLARLARIEDDRAKRKAEFARRLDAARNDPESGFFADVLLPADGARASALIDVDKKGAALIGPDQKPLKGADTLLAGAAKNNQDADAAIELSVALRKEIGDLGQEEIKLQARAVRHADIYQNLLDEQRYLKSFEINWYEQLGTVQRRIQQLVDRLKEFPG